MEVHAKVSYAEKCMLGLAVVIGSSSVFLEHTDTACQMLEHVWKV